MYRVDPTFWYVEKRSWVFAKVSFVDLLVVQGERDR